MNVTDRRTDRRMTCDPKTVQCTKVHCAVKIFANWDKITHLLCLLDFILAQSAILPIHLYFTILTLPTASPFHQYCYFVLHFSVSAFYVLLFSHSDNRKLAVHVLYNIQGWMPWWVGFLLYCVQYME